MLNNLATYLITADPTAPPATTATLPDTGLTWLNTAPIMSLLAFAVVVIVVMGGLAILMKSGRGDMKRSANSAGVIFIGLLVIGAAFTAGLVIKIGGAAAGSFFGG